MLSCKQFLQELNDFLDETLDPQVKQELERHVNECPNCWVICNTTEKTIKVYKGCDAKPVPNDVHDRLMAAVQKRVAARGPFPRPGGKESLPDCPDAKKQS